MSSLPIGRICALAALLLTVAAGVGCAGGRGAEAPGAIERGPAPAYAEVAAQFNERIGRIDALRSTVVAQVTYLDEAGSAQTDQFEGTLQVRPPSEVALSIKKVGKLFAWFGADDARYWWIMLGDEREASVGRHEGFDRAAARGLVAAVRPLDLVEVLGIDPLPEAAGAGATQWSDDGRLLGVTTPTEGGGARRMWLEPASLQPRQIELFDAARRPLVVAELEDDRPVDIANYGGNRPRAASRVTVYHPESETRVSLRLWSMSNSPVSADAFDFDHLVEALGVATVRDLDGPGAGG